MIIDLMTHEEIIHRLTDRILDGDSDEKLKAEGFLETDIEEAYLNCIALYF